VKLTSSVAALLVCAGAFAADSGKFLADPVQSRLEFAGVQAGAEFRGTFHKFTAVVDFWPDTLERSKLDVQIDMASEDTKDKDRDGTMRGPDIFNAEKFPQAHYVTKTIVKTASGYAAQGSLTLRGVTRDVPITFRFSPGGHDARIEGGAVLKRLDFGVGQGDWKSTEWIANDVKVSFSLILKPTSP
jgi:polyisoprenoid-binding protein YceI